MEPLEPNDEPPFTGRSDVSLVVGPAALGQSVKATIQLDDKERVGEAQIDAPHGCPWERMLAPGFRQTGSG